MDFVCWRDRLGIEPSGDGTRLPEGFEDLGVHQLHNRPHVFHMSLYAYTEMKASASIYFSSIHRYSKINRE